VAAPHLTVPVSFLLYASRDVPHPDWVESDFRWNAKPELTVQHFNKVF